MIKNGKREHGEGHFKKKEGGKEARVTIKLEATGG